MSEAERQEPLYGEYASAEEQASALRRSGAEPRQVEPHAARAESKAHPTPGTPMIVPADSRGSRNPLDRIITVFLLSFSAVFIFGGASSYLNLGPSLNDAVKQFGVSEYQVTDQTAAFGIAMLVSQVVLWLLAAVVSYRRITRHKLAWWVPLVAGILSFVVTSVLLGVLLAADPALVAAISAP